MPKYKVQTDQGNFQVELDSEPSSPEQLNELVQLHLSKGAAEQRITADQAERERLTTAEPIPEVTPQKSLLGSIRTGITGIPGGLWNVAKTVGKAAITQPEEGFFTPVSPSTSAQRLADLAKGAASGLSLGMYQPEAKTEPERARQVGGMVAGSVAPFTAMAKGAQALGLGRVPANLAAGGVTGAARPLSEGDIYGAIEGATAGAGSVLIPEALRIPGGVRSAVRGTPPPTPQAVEATKRLTQLENELRSQNRPVAEAQAKLASVAPEARAKGIALEAETAKAQRSLADEARILRQSQTALETEKAALKPPNEEAVGRVADSLLSKPVSKQEAGQFFQGKYKELKKVASKEGGAKYDEAAAIAGDTAFERPGLGQAMNQLMEESGTLKQFLSSAPQRAMKEVKATGAEIVEQPRVDRARQAQSAIVLEEGFFDKYKNYFPPKRPGEPDIMPLELWRDITSGKLSDPRATVSDMIIDRQKIRAAARAAGSAGRYNEARQLGTLEQGITTDIKRSSPDVSKAIDAADAFWRDEYSPRFGFKATPTKGAGRAPEDIVNFFFRKEATKGSEAAAESLASTIKNPADMARLSRAWIDQLVQKSVDKKTGQFSNDTFLKEYLSYPDRVREIAAGGTKAKQQLDEIANLMQGSNVGKGVIKELETAVKESERGVREGARQVSKLAGETPDGELQAAAREVSRLGKEQARGKTALEKEQAGQAAEKQAAYEKRNELMQRMGTWQMGGSLLAITGGAVTGHPAAVVGGMVSLGSGALTRLLASPKGRETVMGALNTTGRNTRDATIWATRINSLLKENGKSKEPEQQAELEPPAPLPGVRAAEGFKEFMHRPVVDVVTGKKR